MRFPVWPTSGNDDKPKFFEWRWRVSVVIGFVKMSALFSAEGSFANDKRFSLFQVWSAKIRMSRCLALPRPRQPQRASAEDESV